MTNDNLFDLLPFEDDLVSVEIINEVELGDASYIFAKLTYGNDATLDVPFIHFAGEDWLFTPTDWQGQFSGDPSEVEDIDWRVNDTEIMGVIVGGLPRLTPWAPDPKDINREIRKAVGAEIRAAREAKGMSIRALAEASGIDKNQICRIEAGRLNATIDTLNSLGYALGMRIGIAAPAPTQICDLINGSPETIRDLDAPKYNGVKMLDNIPDCGGTPTDERRRIAAAVAAEHPDLLTIRVRGVAETIALARHNSASGKSWRWTAALEADDVRAILGFLPEWTHAGADNNYELIVNMDCTVTLTADSGRKGHTYTIGEELVKIL